MKKEVRVGDLVVTLTSSSVGAFVKIEDETGQRATSQLTLKQLRTLGKVLVAFSDINETNLMVAGLDTDET